MTLIQILLKYMWSLIGVHLDSSGLQVGSRWTAENLVAIWLFLWNPGGLQMESTWSMWSKVKYCFYSCLDVLFNRLNEFFLFVCFNWWLIAYKYTKIISYFAVQGPVLYVCLHWSPLIVLQCSNQLPMCIKVTSRHLCFVETTDTDSEVANPLSAILVLIADRVLLKCASKAYLHDRHNPNS